MGEGVSDHTIMGSLIYGNYFATGAMQFMVNSVYMIPFADSAFMAPHDMTMSEFFIFPELFPAGGAVYCEHFDGICGVMAISFDVYASALSHR